MSSEKGKFPNFKHPFSDAQEYSIIFKNPFNYVQQPFSDAQYVVQLFFMFFNNPFNYFQHVSTFSMIFNLIE